VAEHTNGDSWHGAATNLVSHTDQWVPVAVLVAATPIALLKDEAMSVDAVEHQLFRTDTQWGDEVSLVLGLAPIVLGGWVDIADGDSRYLEVSAEAVALTALETQFLKLVVNRERPDGTSEDSFPSGHTSFAFGGATLLARWWAETHDGSLLGYWLYVPATYVGISRLEGNRHYISDITFGAALGIATAHLVWNLHFGDEQHAGLFRERVHAELRPLVGPDGVGVTLSLSF
jgi:hypothetical protein